MARSTQAFPPFSRWIGFLRDRGASFWAFDALYGMQASDKFITSTQVLALNTTGINVVDAPGASRYLMFMGAIVYMKYNSAAYTASSKNLVLTYTDKNGAAISHTIASSLFDGATADVVTYAYPLNAAASALAAA